MPKCNACSAEIEAGAKTCPYCGAENPIGGEGEDRATAVIEGEQGPLQNKGGGQTGLDHEVKTFKCKSCGATVSFDPALKSLACAYCGSATVIEQPTSAALRPRRVVPFGIQHDQAEELFWKWLGKGFFRPRDLTKKTAISDIRGVYLPFFAFDADAQSSWTASAGYHYYENETYSTKDAQGKTVLKTRQVQRTRWQPASGNHQEHYEDWLVSASKGLDQQWVAKIVPFRLEESKDYRGDYLAGFGAENPSIEPETALQTAKAALLQKEVEACRKMVPGDTHKGLNVHTSLSRWNYDLILLPIWIAAYRYKEKVFRFLVNGQTGEVQGVAPFSWLKLIVVLLIGAGLVGLALVLMTVLGK